MVMEFAFNFLYQVVEIIARVVFNQRLGILTMVNLIQKKPKIEL